MKNWSVISWPPQRAGALNDRSADLVVARKVALQVGELDIPQPIHGAFDLARGTHVVDGCSEKDSIRGDPHLLSNPIEVILDDTFPFLLTIGDAVAPAALDSFGGEFEEVDLNRVHLLRAFDASSSMMEVLFLRRGLPLIARMVNERLFDFLFANAFPPLQVSRVALIISLHGFLSTNVTFGGVHRLG